MELSIDREQLTRALSRVQGVLNRKANVQSLSDVFLQAEGQRLRVAATDLEVTFDSYVPAEVLTSGTITVDGKRIFDIVRNLPGGTVTLVTDEQEQIRVSCKGSDFTLKAASPELYPKLPIAAVSELVPCDGLVLRELIARTSFSMSTDTSRPMLNGTLFTCTGDGRIHLVSTDGHRLSQGERNAARGDEIPARDGVIIPRKGVGELKRFLDEVGRDVSFCISGNIFFITAEDMTLFIQLIDSKFPDYRQVIPKSVEHKILVPRLEFLGALKNIETLASDRTHGIKIELRPATMTLRADNPEYGSGRVEVPIEDFVGDEFSIAFNSSYIRDVLSTLSAEKVQIDFNGKLSPAVLREVGNEDYLFVVMPMHL